MTSLSRPLTGLLVLFLLATTGCDDLDIDYRPSATGQEGYVTVVTDSSYWDGPIADALQATVGEYIGTLPAPERTFELQFLDLDSEETFDKIKATKNVLFVAPLEDTSAVANFLRARLPEDAVPSVMAGEQVVYAERENLWRRRQMVVYLAASTQEELAEAIQSRADALRNAFNTVTRQRLTTEMFEKGRQQDLEAELMEEHGFAVNVQHDYYIATDTTDFVWLRRVLADTWRSLYVYYTDDVNPGHLDPEWIYDTRDSLTQAYLQGNVAGYVQIDRRRPLETETIEFLGHYGFETRGLWHMVGPNEEGEIVPYGMGGPFLTYTFYDQDTGRTYMIDGMVFAPGFSKREFLRQMEAIAHTFRTREEVARREAATAEP